MSVLSVGPDAHEEFDVVKAPRAPLEVAISTLERLRVSSSHSNIPNVVSVEIGTDSQDVVGAARVAR